MERSQVLIPALSPPSCRVIAEPKLLLPQVQRVCALAAYVEQTDLIALDSAPTLTDALFDPLLPLPFLHPNHPPQHGGFASSTASAA